MYDAHIRKDGERQSAQEHCRGAAKRASKSLKPVKMEHMAYLAGLLHDMGKFKEEFARYLAEADLGNAKRGSVNHSFAGVNYVLEKWHTPEQNDYPDITAELLAYAIGAHHGLFDCIDEHQNSGFFHRQTKQNIGYQESVKNFLEQCADWKELDRLFQASVDEATALLDQIAALSQQQDDNEANRETCFYISLLERLLLSGVIDGDRADTAEFMNGDVFREWPEDMRGIWAERLAFMEQKLGGFSHEKPIDRARQQISDACAAFAVQPGGVYRLNVPTGGGKTLSALRYALTHAKIWNKSRIIFTSPLLSILDQNAKIIRQYIGDDDMILEHHSNLAEPENEPEQLRKMELLMDTWESPVIITTLVQLLNTCFSGKTSAIRRFHSLCNSVIVIDEVQTVPNKLLTLFNLAVNFLAEVCGTTVILCSATQPSLVALPHPLLRNPPDIVPWQRELWDIFKRTEIQNAGHYRLEEIPQLIEECMSDCASLLVICNKKEEASFLFEALQNMPYQCFHLSAAMCTEHRRETLRSLQAALDCADSGGGKTICISTQVIEAGVDISFQQVIRFAAGMDSVIQAAGRCNRHAQRKEPASVLIVQCTDERLFHLEDIGNGKAATVALLEAFADQPGRFRNDLSADESIEFYYRTLYGKLEANEGFLDDTVPEYGSLYHLLSDNEKYADANCKMVDCYFLRQAFRLAGKLFQVFDENTTDVLVPYGKGRVICEDLISAAQPYADRNWESIRKDINAAKSYSVSLYQNQLEKLMELGAVTALFDESVYVLSDGFYNENTGFSMKNGIAGFQEV